MTNRDAARSWPATRPALTAAALMALTLGVSAPAVAAVGAKSKPNKTVGGQVEKSGEILVVSSLHGGEPQLTDEQSKRFLLSGQWRKELLRLGGHKVQVWGRLGKKKLMQRTIEVERYEILDSGGGRKPQVGLLLRGDNDTLRLQVADTSLKVTAQPALRKLLVKRVGCKVWIVGELSAASLKASKFGWLTCRVNRSIKPKKETPR